MMENKAILIGMAGGTGSGKTLVSQTIYSQLGSERVFILEQDAYYRDLGEISFEERVKTNFDHPDALDTPLLVKHIKELLRGGVIKQPIYDFVTHTRKPETRRVGPHDVVILEGILVLENPKLRDLMDIKVYVDTDADIRLLRRIRRDTLERGRTLESIIDQYERNVRPMHLQFVEPTKRFADIIIPEGGKNVVAVDLLKTKIVALLQERK